MHCNTLSWQIYCPHRVQSIHVANSDKHVSHNQLVAPETASPPRHQRHEAYGPESLANWMQYIHVVCTIQSTVDHEGLAKSLSFPRKLECGRNESLAFSKLVDIVVFAIRGHYGGGFLF
mmetsp:Transcript_3359/g.6111  ORF Transcript_3359/g.6111 Transcript_3359/m.6111 type:complete len:119 (+) Transcript_3359:3463-3819(+)